MNRWKIAAVQMDCRLGDVAHNLATMCTKLVEAAEHGAQLVVFPECALSGYGFDSLEQARPHAESVPGPATRVIETECRRRNVFAAFGLLECDSNGRLFNACALVGPDGLRAGYRKVHLPFLGVDRFTTPGDRPFAIHDLGGLRVGMLVCYDASFPEAARSLALSGADLIVLPTNWPKGALSTVRFVVQARALENHVYFAAVNRVGEEGGFRFIGMSRVIDCNGDLIASTDLADEQILYAEIDPSWARQKRIVHVPGKYEIDRINDRRPEMYTILSEPKNHATQRSGRSGV